VIWNGIPATRDAKHVTDLDPWQVIRHGIALDAVDAAEIRRCPKCRRKYALRLTSSRTIQCRWDNCGFRMSQDG
jgi:hypothetical protein